MKLVNAQVKNLQIDIAWDKSADQVTFTPWCESHNINRRISFLVSNACHVIREGLELQWK